MSVFETVVSSFVVFLALWGVLRLFFYNHMIRKMVYNINNFDEEYAKAEKIFKIAKKANPNLLEQKGVEGMLPKDVALNKFHNDLFNYRIGWWTAVGQLVLCPLLLAIMFF